MDAKLTNLNRILVSDGFARQIAVLELDGSWVGTIGRPGQGPGEFGLPALLSVDRNDSLFVWDSRLSRVSVFSPTGAFVRSFRVLPSWAITGIEFLPDGTLLVAGFSLGDTGGLHHLDRNGRALASFSPPPSVPQVWAYDRSLLGGHIAQHADWLAYSIRSPFELRFFTLDRRPTYRCIGPANWTTRPEDVVIDSGRVGRLEYGRYIHSARLLALSNDLVLNVIFDPVNERRILDVLTPKCEWLRRQVIELPVFFTDFRNGWMVGVQNVEVPEVIVYQVKINRGHRDRDGTQPRPDTKEGN